MPSQKQRVLRELKNAGKEGVRSDRFYELHIPRAGARILELKEEGLEITSTKERQFVRYALVEPCAICMGEKVIEGVYPCPRCMKDPENVERGADRAPALVKQGCQVQTGGSLSLDASPVLVDNQAPLSASLPPSGGRPSAMYDAWSEWA